MKVLLFDIENSPDVAYTWGLYNEITSTDFIVSEWYILCWCAKWLDKNGVMSSALIDNNGYKPYVGNDKELCKKLWRLLDEADVVVAHNAVQFDVKKANTRFLMHGMTPPSPYKIVDTLKVARRYFKFTSNRLDDLGKYLGVGRKVDTGGFQLWIDCMAGKKSAWRKMIKYCKQDVLLLERVYKKLLPYIKTHPNRNVYSDNVKTACPKCGSIDLVREGFKFLSNGKKQQYSCKSCGGWCTDGKIFKNS